MMEKRKTERLVIGICAHVDAGKTTLSEQILFETGVIRKTGRVDTKDAFLDTDAMEKARGITIYAKQAVFPALTEGLARTYTLLDTPGHADFRAETERTMAVLDAAVLLISAAEGVNAQVRLIWSMLAHYRVPAFIFVNKMDQAEAIGEGEARRALVLREIRDHLSPYAVLLPDGPGGSFPDPETEELLALAAEDEDLIEQVLEGGHVPPDTVRKLIRGRQIVPVCFGSALKDDGVRELLYTLDRYLDAPDYSASPETPFSARVIKILRDKAGERETWMKLTGGTLRVRDPVTYTPRTSLAEPGKEEENEEENESAAGISRELTEKITRIRIWNGEKYTDVSEAYPGMVVCAAGLTRTLAGQGLGEENAAGSGLFRPVVRWELLLPGGMDPFDTYRKLQLLEEEDPLLSLTYDWRKKALFAVLGGQVAREIFADTVRKRFGISIEYGRPDVIYKETIRTAVEGVGHFEPLRHYAEVHLLLTPGEEGSGLVYENACSPDILPRQYQHQIMEALRGRRHRGVLTGSEITDMKITLVAGKSHLKHTEGGDFRQAAGRAVRQGLMMAESVLLEPWYDFELILPQDKLGRAMADLSAMGASFGLPETVTEGDASSVRSLLRGTAPVRAMDAYQEELTAYTKGEGTVTLTVGAYRPCVDAEAVISEKGYDPELDVRQPTGSVFCSHGAGTVIPWYEVRSRMHIDTGLMREDGSLRSEEELETRRKEQEILTFRQMERKAWAAEDELMAIFERTYGPVRRQQPQSGGERRSFSPEQSRPVKVKNARPSEQYLLVDGYNIIYAWTDLKELAAADLKAARDRLMDILSNYAGSTSEHVILVYDAYRVAGGTERIMDYHNIKVVFTKEAETADQYIEKTAHTLTKQYGVRVATSDAIEQMIIYGAGAVRVSARDLLLEIIAAREELQDLQAQGSKMKETRLQYTLGELAQLPREEDL